MFTIRYEARRSAPVKMGLEEPQVLIVLA